ncbi:PREDICTED: putative helicase MOV-10 isoform X1 [Rhagoletis zephyria]|uniref:putative helicase MOV-10 isoform X1 n=1 Tax=Rhagoletis zephyria TaxID=28612 RepID=UPI00081144EB|nr:PREDICTED: putative helicase MOV-10 isoform X1 [Rhagoletis zephyria]
MSGGQVLLPGISNIKSECVFGKNGAADNALKPHKAEEWEIEAVGQFLFEEYHNLVFGPRTDWLVRKSVLRANFTNYLQSKRNDLRQRLLEANGTSDVGTLLSRTNYLINTQRGSESYRIRSASFYQHINKKIEELDEKRKNGETTEYMANGDEGKSALNGDPALIESLQVEDNAPTHELLYEGSLEQERESVFQLTNMGCYICQMNFGSPTSFEEHVEEHGDESDFKLLKDYFKSVRPVFELSYNVCKNSHYFRFNLVSIRRNIVIEKLVIVQTRTFYYVHNTRVPYALGADRKDHFFVDCHLFRKGVVQPIVVVFHDKFNKQKRYVEQHHFCRVEEFPVVKLSINPCRLPNKIKFKPMFKLPQYMPPVEIRRALQTDFIKEPLSQLSNDFRQYLDNKKTLTQQNVRDVLLKLLQIEDWDTMREYSSLVQRNVKLRKYENDYIVKPKTPKHIRFENIVFPYDDVIVLPTDEGNTIPNTLDGLMNRMEQLAEEPGSQNQSEKKKTKSYLGQIECISYGRVTFKCDKKIPDDKTYTILFRPSRMVLRYQYRALEQLVAMPADILKKFLFPEEVRIRELPALWLNLRNKSIYKNPEQLQAIQCVVNNSVEKMAPYIIFGPPGTGKTTTLVEAILQIYILQPQSRILITAGSNGACDEIALRLCNVLAPMNETQTITRIYSRAYEQRSENINELLLEYSNLYADHFLPDVKVLHAYRIVVCTLSIVGRLATGKFGKEIDGSGVFTHVFVDEVAASTETETLVGIMATLSAPASLVISGDHRQLGPLLNSKRAADLGLEVSLMERLLERDCYRVDLDGNYNRQIQTRLCRNFRSHPEIVNLYSEMYYEGRLKAEAEPAVQQLCRDWHRSPNAEYPIIFHSIFGPEQRENNSTSLYNLLEITTVMDYVRDLLYFGIKGHKITQSDIGIITPYKKQYMRIQDELNLRNWYQVETGAVESFQGKEKNVIIVSFVRSFSKTLGFLDSPRRLNVTLSRARSILILIGNPRTLSQNEDFKHIIEQCQLHNTLVGAAYHEDGPSVQKDKSNNGQMQQLAKSMEKLNVNKKNIADDDSKNGAKSKARNKKKRQKKAKKNAIGDAQANERASDAANEALKSKNSSAFKTAKPASAEKQRQTFTLYKDLYLSNERCVRESATTGTISNNSNAQNNKSEIEDLFAGLPRVPQQHDFEIINLPPQPNTVDEDLDQIIKRLNLLKRKSKPSKQTFVPATADMTAKGANVMNPARSQTPTAAAAGYTNSNVERRYTLSNLHSINERATNVTATQRPENYSVTPTIRADGIPTMNSSGAQTLHIDARVSTVASPTPTANAGVTPARCQPVYASGPITFREDLRRSGTTSNTATASERTPASASSTPLRSQANARVFVGHAEYPTSPRYVQTRTEPPKSSKKSCVIA